MSKGARPTRRASVCLLAFHPLVLSEFQRLLENEALSVHARRLEPDLIADPAKLNVPQAHRLATGNREAIAAGMRDRLHEPYRARLFPHLTPMTDAARQAGAIGAALSGAGPTILTLVEPANVESGCRALSVVAAEHDVQGEVRALAPTSSGVSLEPL